MHAPVLVHSKATRGCLLEGALTPLEALQSRNNRNRADRTVTLTLDVLLSRVGGTRYRVVRVCGADHYVIFTTAYN